MSRLKPYYLLALLTLALALRLPFLDGSFWLDEAAQALESTRPLAEQLQLAPDFQPPLLHLLLHFASYLSIEEWWLRLIGAFVPGLLSIYFTYKIGEKLGGIRTAVIAAGLLTTSSFHIFFSQELRPYSLPTMWALVSWWLLVRETDLSRASCVQYGLITALGLYSSYLYPFLWLSQAAWSWWQHRQSFKRFFLASAGAGVLFVPWLPSFLEQLSVGGVVRTDLPGWEAVVSFSQLKSLPLVAGKFLFGVVELSAAWWISGSLLALVLVGVVAIYENSTHLNSRKAFPKSVSTLVMLATWIVVPLITAWIVSFWVPIIQPKRVMYLLPAGYLLLGYLAHQFKTRSLYALVAIVFGLNLVGTYLYYTQAHLQRENWQGLHQEISERYQTTSTIMVFAFPDEFASWEWYNRGMYPSLSTGVLSTQNAQFDPNALSPVIEYEYVIVFDYLRDLTDPDNVVLEKIESLGFEPFETLDYPQIGFVRVYARPTARLSTLSV